MDQRDSFLLDPDHGRFARGESRWLVSRKHGCLVLFVIPFVFAGVLVLLFTVDLWLRLVRLSTDSAETSGQFLSKEVDSSGDSTTYYVTYRFVAGDRNYTIEEAVTESTYDATTTVGL
jgi:hypothetical protein